MRFNVVPGHVPGKDQVIATTATCDQRLDAVEAVQKYVEGMLSTVPILDPMLRCILDATDSDDELQNVTHGSWPRHLSQADECLHDLYHVRSELSVVKGILVRAHKIVVPPSLRSEILDKLPSGHQGIAKCRARANETVWWPGLSKAIESLIARCAACQTKSHSDEGASQEHKDARPTVEKGRCRLVRFMG